MLLIVIDDEDSQDEQAGQNTANNFCEWMKVPERSHRRSGQQSQRRDDHPPTSGRDIMREWFRGKDQVSARASDNG